VKVFDIVIEGMALEHQTKRIIKADADFPDIAMYADIKIMDYNRG